LRMVVAMEAALADGRYEEAARVRDEYRKLVSGQATKDGAAQSK
jgi:flagella basal body P-ring formation protein FlgA